jgi:PAS domain S-box-containing protein
MNLIRKINESIVLSILLPIVAIALVISVLAVSYLTRSFDSLRRDQVATDLKLAVELGMGICEERLNNLLSLHLEQDPEMMAAYRNRALGEIKQLSKKFHNIHLLVIENQNTVLAASRNFPPQRLRLLAMSKRPSTLVTADLWGEPLLLYYEYFPLWRWHLVSFISAEDYAALAIFTKRVIYTGVFVGLTIVLLLVFLIFYLRVQHPLHNLIRATVALGAGKFETLEVKRRDEIGQVSLAFNEMVTKLGSAHEALRKSEATLRSLFRAAPIGISLTQNRFFLLTNEEVSRMTGYAAGELEGKSPRLFYASEAEFQRVGTEKIRQIRERGVGLIETQWRRRDGQIIDVLLTSSFIDPNDPAAGAVSTALDITARKRVEAELRQYQQDLEQMVEERTLNLSLVNQALQREIAERRRTEQALMESETRFRTIFEGAPVGISLRDQEGRLVACNPALEKILGYSEAELKELGWAFLHADNRSQFLDLFHDLLAGRRQSFNVESLAVHKNGSLVWGQMNISLLAPKDGQDLYTLCLIQNITADKQLQAERLEYEEKLRSLAAELTLAEERERRRLAVDLHDHIGQILALVQIRLGELSQVGKAPVPANIVQEIRDHVGEAIYYTRSLTFELGLPVLYDLGLEAAVEWLAEQYQAQHGLSVIVQQDMFPKPLGEATSLLVFRILREVLTNVVKHARASRVDINLRRDDHHLLLQVADDGIGFSPVKFAASSMGLSGYGLFSIKERLGHMGGSLDIESRPDHGTLVTISIPLAEPPSKASNSSSFPPFFW